MGGDWNRMESSFQGGGAKGGTRSYEKSLQIRACKYLHVSYGEPVGIVEGQGVRGGQAALWEQSIASLSNSRVSRSQHEGM